MARGEVRHVMHRVQTSPERSWGMGPAHCSKGPGPQLLCAIINVLLCGHVHFGTSKKWANSQIWYYCIPCWVLAVCDNESQCSMRAKRSVTR